MQGVFRLRKRVRCMGGKIRLWGCDNEYGQVVQWSRCPIFQLQGHFTCDKASPMKVNCKQECFLCQGLHTTVHLSYSITWDFQSDVSTALMHAVDERHSLTHCATCMSVFRISACTKKGCCNPGAAFLSTAWSIVQLPSSDACICLASDTMPYNQGLIVCISYLHLHLHGAVRRDESGDEYFCCCVCCRTVCATLMAAATSSSSGFNSKAFLRDARSHRTSLFQECLFMLLPIMRYALVWWAFHAQTETGADYRASVGGDLYARIDAL